MYTVSCLAGHRERSDAHALLHTVQQRDLTDIQEHLLIENN